MNNQGNRKRDKEAQMKTIYLTLSLALIMIAVLITLSATFKKAEVDTVDTSKESVANVTESDIQVMVTDKDITTETTTKETTTPKAETTAPKEEVAVLPKFISPTAGIMTKGHSGDTPVFSITMNDYRPHQGVDVCASVGDDVYAAAAGVVKEIWEDPMEGNCISIMHEGGAVSIYKNLSPTVPDGLKAGSSVSAGEVIGAVGESSLVEIADEAHLHFELTVNGEQVDPVKYISFAVADTEYEG